MEGKPFIYKLKGSQKKYFYTSNIQFYDLFQDLKICKNFPPNEIKTQFRKKKRYIFDQIYLLNSYLIFREVVSMEEKQLNLKDILSKYEVLQIQQKEGQLFCVYKNKERFNITRFKQELIKILQQTIRNQIKKPNQCDITKIFEIGYQLYDKIIQLKGVEIINELEISYQFYYDLLLELTNQGNGDQEYQIEISNPFLIKNNTTLTFYAKEMKLFIYEIYKCKFKQWESLHNIEGYWMKLKQSGFSKIIIDTIEICAQKEIKNCNVQDMQYCIQNGIKNAGMNDDSFLEIDECNHQIAVDVIDLHINLKDVKCNHLIIRNECEDFEVGEYVNTFTITVGQPLSKLSIILQQYYNAGIFVKFKFLNTNSYISRLSYDTFGQKDFAPRLYYMINKQSLQFNQISEYEYYIGNNNDISNQEILQMDYDCQKIIYFKTKFALTQNLSKFIFLRNNSNAMKFQIFAFHHLIAPLLLYSPEKTLYDLYVDFENPQNKKMNNRNMKIINLKQSLSVNQRNLSQTIINNNHDNETVVQQINTLGIQTQLNQNNLIDQNDQMKINSPQNNEKQDLNIEVQDNNQYKENIVEESFNNSEDNEDQDYNNDEDDEEEEEDSEFSNEDEIINKALYKLNF